MEFRALLVSTYELGRQPFGLASPVAWLRNAGVQADCLDLALDKLDQDLVRRARLIAFYLPMHTATRIASRVIPAVRELNPHAHLCAYGLYAPVNAGLLGELGIHTILGGEFEEGLRNLAIRLQGGGNETPLALKPESLVSLAKQTFLPPERDGLPILGKYAKLNLPDGSVRLVGYTEASRGCKHQCRHCPIVPVYRGTFRIVQREVVLEDIRRQVKMGAEHITFGDPDFFNGIGHAIPLLQQLHTEHPRLSYDVTIKVEHLLKHVDALVTLRDTGCAFVTSAIESVDDKVLRVLDKGHTRSDFVRLVKIFRRVGLPLIPTFVTFTPWMTLEGYEDLLGLLASLGQVENVASIQLAIRLLIPSGSLLLERPEIQAVLQPFDDRALSYGWKHPDLRVDELQRGVEALVRRSTAAQRSRPEIFGEIWKILYDMMERPPRPLPPIFPGRTRATIPYLTEPWFC
jgi:radical SAM superfamily enzyme YgiQ (UPF0313 family)